MMTLKMDAATLQAALVGYKQQLEHIQQKMAEIRRSLGKSNGTHAAAGSITARTTRRKHRMSAEGRARIAAAQKARWAKARKQAAKAS